MRKEEASQSEKHVTTRRKPPREKSASARAFEDWTDVIFDTSGRAVQGVAPLAVFAFAAIELINPDMLGQHHISAELAQTLLGGSLGALGIDIFGRRSSRR
jgi:Na+/H+-translocating membrane pyrophosphatase